MKYSAALLSVLASRVYRLRWFLLLVFSMVMFVLWLQGLKGVTVTVSNHTRWLNPQQLQQKMLQAMDNRWLLVSIEKIKAAAEQVDWVDQVRVKRVWPARLVLEIEEQQPIACWNNMALTNREKLIKVKRCPSQWLKVQAQKQFIKPFVALQPLLQQLAGQGMKIEQISINERGTWLMKTDQQVQLLARNKDITERLQLWLKVLKQKTFENPGDLKKVDLRYPNGFSVQMNITAGLNPGGSNVKSRK